MDRRPSRSSALARKRAPRSEDRRVKASINGEEHQLPDGLTLAGLLEHLQAPTRGIAVAKNDRVVQRAHLDRELVADGDRIEIIQAVAGG